MTNSQRRVALAVLILVAAVVGACDRKETGSASAPGGGPADSATPAPPPGSLEIKFAYGSEKKDWIADVTAAFNAEGRKVADGRPVYVTHVPMGSGESIDDIVTGRTQAHLVSPASGVFVTLGNARWRSTRGEDLVGPTQNLVLSPVVIAMWKPMAEALGWPDKPIGWAEVLRLAQDPAGWASVGKPQWGSFKFGHTHPQFSNSGLISVLAEVYAAAGKVRGLTREDLNKPEVAQSLAGIERAVVHYGSSTGFFADRMFENGTGYLSAAVLYESSVIDSYNRPQPTEFPVIAIYPKEGTFWSDHPVGVVQREWVKDEHREAAKMYVEYLRAEPQQRKALRYGFRPGDTAVAVSAPVDAAHGADPSEPKTTLEVPPAQVVDAAVALWRKHKKHSNVVLVFDTSGSMKEENRIAHAREGAAELVRMLDDEDTVSLLAFSGELHWLHRDVSVKAARQQVIQTISSLTPDGATALYDATAAAHKALTDSPKPGHISAVVVLTDGEDTAKRTTLDTLLRQIRFDAERNSVRVFTIAYGGTARKDILKGISDATKAKSFEGKPQNIREVFKEIATFF